MVEAPIFTTQKGFGFKKRSLNWFLFQRKENQGKPRKKLIMMKDEDVNNEKTRKNQVDGEVLHLIDLGGKMELEFAINVKKIKF